MLTNLVVALDSSTVHDHYIAMSKLEFKRHPAVLLFRDLVAKVIGHFDSLGLESKFHGCRSSEGDRGHSGPKTNLAVVMVLFGLAGMP